MLWQTVMRRRYQLSHNWVQVRFQREAQVLASLVYERSQRSRVY